MPSSRESEFGGVPLEPLLCSEAELDALEVLNGIVLAQYTTELASEWKGAYCFTPEIVRKCNQIAMDGIYACAGEYRTRCVTAGDFVGAHHRDIPRLVEEMCHPSTLLKATPFRLLLTSFGVSTGFTHSTMGMDVFPGNCPTWRSWQVWE